MIANARIHDAFCGVQRDLRFTLAADLDLQQYPRQIGAKVTHFSYQLEGRDIPVAGIKGEGSEQAVYQQSPQQIALSQLMLSANDDSQVTCEANAQLGPVPAYMLSLSATQLNLDTLSA